MLQPIIPKRPERKKTEGSTDPETSAPSSLKATSESVPVIPKRPVKLNSGDLNPESSSAPSTNPEDTHNVASEAQKTKPLSEKTDDTEEIEGHGKNVDSEENVDASNPNNNIESNEVTDVIDNKQGLDGDDGDDEGDEETLGNSSAKLSNKDISVNQDSNETEASPMKEDQNDSQLQKESSVESLRVSGDDTGNIDESKTTTAEVEQDAGVVEPKNDSKDFDNASSESTTSGHPVMPIIPQRPKMTSKLLKSSIEPETMSAKETDGDEDSNGMPLIPSRPEKKTTSEKDVASNHEQKEVEKENKNVSLTEEEKSKTSTPIIPSRPVKPKTSVSSIPSGSPSSQDSGDKIPSKPESKVDRNDTGEKTDKPKAPPPKPKKLSSKIAAFQEMLNKPQESESRPLSSSGSLPKVQPEDLKIEDKAGLNPTSVPPRPQRNKLSSSHMQFAQNLQGIMGRGFALPGMVDPSKLGRNDSNDQINEDANDNEDNNENDNEEGVAVSESAQLPRQEPVRRTRGPRGKRLPKNLSTPINIEQAPKFEIVQHLLWSVEFKKPIDNSANEDSTSQTEVKSIDEELDSGYIADNVPLESKEENNDGESIEDEPPLENSVKTLLESPDQEDADDLQEVLPHKKSDFNTDMNEMDDTNAHEYTNTDQTDAVSVKDSVEESVKTSMKEKLDCNSDIECSAGEDIQGPESKTNEV